MANKSSMTDGEVPELTADELAKFRPAREVLSPEQFAAVTGRGRPKSAVRKVQVTLKLDPEVVESYKAAGKGHLTRMQNELTKSAKAGSGYMAGARPSLAELHTVRSSKLRRQAKAAGSSGGKKRA